MRWVVFCFVVLFAAPISISPAALADDKNVTIKVTVLDADGKPVKDARVYVRRWPVPGPPEEGQTKEDGSFSDTDRDGIPYASDTYEISVSASTDSRYARTIVYVSSGDKSPVVLTLDRFPGSFVAHLEKATAAAQGGDSAGYEQSVKDAQNSIKPDENVADAAQQAADDFARDNDLPVKDLRGVTKDIERAGKLPENLQDKERLGKLNGYREKLQGVQNIRNKIEKQKKQLAEITPPEKKFGFVPSACPEGQSGGLLAGGINSVFGTDLAGICDDKQPQHRDIDREKGGDRHEKDEHDLTAALASAAPLTIS